MKILILTQAEGIYLPGPLATVVSHFHKHIACIVTAPAMSTHGGPVRGFIRHLKLFGLWDTTRLSVRVLRHRILDLMTLPTPAGPFYSIRSVAKAFQIPFYHVDYVNRTPFKQIVSKHQPDLLISMSCPQVIGKSIRSRFPMGAINVHGAPLPRYRGLMPAFWALCHHERSTAVTVHDLADHLDDGEILVQRHFPITAQDTWDSLVRKSKQQAALALIEAVHQIADGTVTRKPNNASEATYYSFPGIGDRNRFLESGRRFF